MSLLAAFSIPCAVVPALAFLWLMWWLDRYDREPWWLFGSAFLWGAGPAVAIAVFGLIPLAGAAAAPGPSWGLALEGAILAPLIEEPAKAAILLVIARSRHFDNTTDGFVYGAAAGIGFAMTENLLYFNAFANDGDPGTWLAVVSLRTLYCALMHASATSVVGAALGFAKYRRPRQLGKALAAGLLGAFLIHALWNGLLVAGTLFTDGFSVLDLLLFPVEFLVLFGIFQACLLDEARILRHELGEEAEGGLLPPEYADRLSRWLDRTRAGWLPAGVDHPRLVRAATTLAFRKDQRAGGATSAALDAEIEALRREIRGLLADPSPGSMT